MRINLFNLGFLAFDQCFLCYPPVDDIKIGIFISLVCGIDDAAVANDGRAHVWVAHASRVLVSASRRNRLFPSIVTFCDAEFQEKSAIARTRSPARATRALPRLA